MAARQLALTEAAKALHANYIQEGGISSATHAATGTYSEASDGMLMNALIAKHQPTDLESAIPMVAEGSFPGEVVDLAARSFVYELAVFRLMLRSVSLHAADQVAAQMLCSQFDIAVPGLVPVRDTLAHLDERFAGLSRGRSINPVATTVGTNILDLGIVVRNDRIGAHTADGSFQEVMMTSATIDAALDFIRGMTLLFPATPPSVP